MKNITVSCRNGTQQFELLLCLEQLFLIGTTEVKWNSNQTFKDNELCSFYNNYKTKSKINRINLYIQKDKREISCFIDFFIIYNL